MFFLSMTSSITAAQRDETVLPAMSQPDARFVFACTREHVFGAADRAPGELTWASDSPSRERYVTAADVSSETWAFWEKFRDLVAAADADGRVWWGLGRGNDQESGALYTHADLPEDQYRWCTPLLERKLVEDGHDVYKPSLTR